MRAARVEAKSFLVSAQNQLQQTSNHSLHYWKFNGYPPLDRLHKIHYTPIRQRNIQEVAGQIFRVFGALTKTIFGLIPSGNTGGSNVSPFKKMPVSPELQAIIKTARST